MSAREEVEGKFYMGKNKIYAPEDPIQKMIKDAKLEKAKEDATQILLEAEQAKQTEIEKKLETLEIVPIGNKIVLAPYPRNPYRKIMQGSIIVDYDGTFANPDSGEQDKMQELVACAKVIEVGPDCKYAEVGDDVYYDPRSTYPMPFMSLGHKLTTEPQILCIINENLKARLKMS